MCIGEQTRNGSQRLAVSTILAASARTVQLDAPAAATDLQAPDVEFARYYDILRYRVVISYELATFLLIHRNLNVPFFSFILTLCARRFLSTIRDDYMLGEFLIGSNFHKLT